MDGVIGSSAKKSQRNGVLVDIQVAEEEDSDDYDPNLSDFSSSDESEKYKDSDFGYSDDDALYEANVDKELEFAGVGSKNAMVKAVDDLQSLGSSSDELRSIDSLFDEGGTSHMRQYPIFNVHYDIHSPQFKLGMEFKSHNMFRNAVNESAINWGKHITFTKNDKQKVRAKCKVGSPWVCYASCVKHNGLYRIKTLVDEHTCNRSFNVAHVSSKWIVSRYFKRIRLNPTWPIQSLEDTISSEHNVKIRDINPGTTVCMKVKQIPKVNEGSNPTIIDGSNTESKFKRLYLCWGPLKKAFMNACRPVIGVDGCHLKGSHGGILLTAIGIDANNCIFPFAYAIVEKEKKKTWLWFVELLGHDLNIVNSHCYIFMSDKQKKAARATIVPAFTRVMAKIKEVDCKAYDWLVNRPPIHWSRIHFNTFPKCDLLLNNLCECFNASVLEVRSKPVVTMLEKIRLLLMETVQKKKRDVMQRHNGPICPKIQNHLEKMKVDAGGWIPKWNGNEQFEVIGPYGEQYKLDLQAWTCGCKNWDLSSIPCAHVVAAANFLGQKP
ncbi:uncharacterized protein LOC114286062 [Camellia sinensis]|uniref:uncharacterized protein LOC114286062 n=1 Tax=Camellia sinensis TaxID=4442 RepID=UPI001036078E|nr:uncharacterized protein LOC114286062 [Camellia sinensis]